MLVGLSLMPTDDFRRAALPLFSAGLVDAVEWSVDVRYAEGMPVWFSGLLDFYSQQGRLYAHGVHYSTLTAGTRPHHAEWLQVAADATQARTFQHFSEHYGFMVAGGFRRGAPMPLPNSPTVLRLGRERLAALKDATGLPVGLENLALAFSRRDALAHGAFLEALLEPSGGFVLLDLHNLWCQAVNYGIDPVDLLKTFPLERVREVHLSGGSWTDLPGGGRFRRDTHDNGVPDALFALLADALPLLPACELVILERMGGTIRTPAEEQELADDFRRIRATVDGQ